MHSERSRLHRLAEHLPVESGGIRLRMLEVRDAARYVLGATDPQTARWAYAREDDLTPADVAERIVGVYRDDAERGHAARFAIADAATDDYVGVMTFFDDRDDSVEIGFVITPDRRGVGVARGALAVTEHVAQRAGYSTLRARTDVENSAARRTLTKAGYLEAGDPTPPISASLEGVLLQPFAKPLCDPASPLPPPTER